VPLSHAIGETWPTELKRDIGDAFPRHQWRNRARAQDVTALFAKVVDRAVSSHDDGIIKYALRQVDRSRSWNARWDVLEPFLAHCAIQFPHSFDYVARVIAWRARRDEDYDHRLWKEVALTVAASAASVGHESELLWALWLLKELGNKVSARQIDQFTKIAGPLVFAFLAHMTVNGQAGRADLLDKLEAMAVGSEQFTGTLWPVTLELYHLGNSAHLEAYRAAGTAVSAAYHAAGASIIDWQAMPRVFDREEGEAQGEDWEPDYAIEDYASAYDDDEDDAGPAAPGWGTLGLDNDAF